MITPSKITVNKEKNLLKIYFKGIEYQVSSEFLRVNSPSAEVKGHRPEEAILQLNKENVLIKNITPMGNYAVIIHFDDDHKTGIYSWKYLYHLVINKEDIWSDYLQKVAKISAK